MSNPLLQLIDLAGIAIFLILRLKNVLGTRDGFEPPQVDQPTASTTPARFEVIEGSADEVITTSWIMPGGRRCRGQGAGRDETGRPVVGAARFPGRCPQRL